MGSYDPCDTYMSQKERFVPILGTHIAIFMDLWPKMDKNGQKGHFPNFGLYAYHLTGHVGYLWMHTDEIDHIQKELAQLEPWGKKVCQKTSKK